MDPSQLREDDISCAWPGTEESVNLDGSGYEAPGATLAGAAEPLEELGCAMFAGGAGISRMPGSLGNGRTIQAEPV